MRRILVLLIAALAISTQTWAQDSGHAHHGGQTAKVGKYEVELVVKGNDITAYVLDEQTERSTHRP